MHQRVPSNRHSPRVSEIAIHPRHIRGGQCRRLAQNPHSQQTGAHPYPAAQLTSHTETRRGTSPPNDHAMPPSVPIRGLLPGVVLRSSGLLRALRGSAGGTGRAPSRSLRLTSACNAVTPQAFGFHFVGTPSADPRCVHGTTRRAGVLGGPPRTAGRFFSTSKDEIKQPCGSWAAVAVEATVASAAERFKGCGRRRSRSLAAGRCMRI